MMTLAMASPGSTTAATRSRTGSKSFAGPSDSWNTVLQMTAMMTGVVIIGTRNSTRNKRPAAYFAPDQQGQPESEHVLDRDRTHRHQAQPPSDSQKRRRRRGAGNSPPIQSSPGWRRPSRRD